MKIILASIALLLATAAHASIGGEWIGWGEWKYEGSVMRCNTIHLVFKENSTQLARAVGTFDCDMTFMELPPLTLNKNGANLVMDQKLVGNFTESHYYWIEPYSPTVNVEVMIDRVANHLNYHERWVNLSGQEIYLIDAAVFLHQ